MNKAVSYLLSSFCLIIITSCKKDNVVAMGFPMINNSIVVTIKQAGKTSDTSDLSIISDLENIENQSVTSFKQPAINHQPSPSEEYL